MGEGIGSVDCTHYDPTSLYNYTYVSKVMRLWSIASCTKEWRCSSPEEYTADHSMSRRCNQ